MRERTLRSSSDLTTSAKGASRIDPTDHVFDMMHGETFPFGATHNVEPEQLPQRFDMH
jgi:hypothetical protein